jgi:Zn-dependent M28 family amino/carboxypeptidase
VIRENNSRSVNYKLDYTYNDLNHPLRLYYRSDHYNFAELGIPSVFFFGGFHKDYHQATDDTYLINTTKVEDITKLVYFTVIDLANKPGEILTKYKSN